jgi:WD40 repeat protein
MHTKHHDKSLLMLCLLIVLMFVNVSCGVSFLPDVGLAPSVSETTEALATAVPLSPQNMERIEPLYQFSVTDPANDLLWSPDSRLLAVQTARWPTIPLGEPLRTDGLVLWNLTDGKGQQIYSDVRLSPTGQATSSLAFSADGQILASQEGASFYLWDTQQNRATNIFTDTHTLDAAQALGIPLPSTSKFPTTNRSPFSLDGKLVIRTQWACGRADTPKLELFDAASGEKLRDLEGCYPFAF